MFTYDAHDIIALAGLTVVVLWGIILSVKAAWKKILQKGRSKK